MVEISPVRVPPVNVSTFQFGDEGFHERGDAAYCKGCYFGQFAPRCARCNDPITENFISSLNKQVRTSYCRAEVSFPNCSSSKQFPTISNNFHAPVLMLSWLSNRSHLVASGLFCMQRMPGTIQRRIFLRTRRFPVLRDVLPRHPRLPLCDVSQANLGPLHHGHVQEIPPGMFRLQVGGDSKGTLIGINLTFNFQLLFEAAQQGNFQGARRQAILS